MCVYIYVPLWQTITLPDSISAYCVENLSHLAKSGPSPMHIDTHSMATIQQSLVPLKIGL